MVLLEMRFERRPLEYEDIFVQTQALYPLPNLQIEKMSSLITSGEQHFAEGGLASEGANAEDKVASIVVSARAHHRCRQKGR
jgi:hypothetical protein